MNLTSIILRETVFWFSSYQSWSSKKPSCRMENWSSILKEQNSSFTLDNRKVSRTKIDFWKRDLSFSCRGSVRVGFHWKINMLEWFAGSHQNVADLRVNERGWGFVSCANPCSYSHPCPQIRQEGWVSR